MLEVSHLICERADQILFSNLTFKVEPGTLFRVAGPNGSGKSTLLKILTGLIPATAGKITWQNTSISDSCATYNSEILYIGHKLGLLPSLTPVENLKWLLGLSSGSSFGLSSGLSLSLSSRLSSNLSSKNILDTILSVLQKLGLQGYQDTPCNRLSSGQQQRVALARLWLQHAKVWILDEPYTALDFKGQNLVKSQISQYLNQGGAVIMTDHHHADGHVKIANEEIIWLGQEEQA